MSGVMDEKWFDSSQYWILSVSLSYLIWRPSSGSSSHEFLKSVYDSHSLIVHLAMDVGELYLKKPVVLLHLFFKQSNILRNSKSSSCISE